VLGIDNNLRAQAEEKLNQAKNSDSDKYAGALATIINPTNGCPDEIRSIAAVILRRNISVTSVDTSDAVNKDNNINLWFRISEDARNFVKQQIITALNGNQAKDIMHKTCNLATEIQGAMQEHENDTIW